MLKDPDLTEVEKTLTTAQNFFVVLPMKLTLDKVAGALGLYLSLKKAGRRVSIFCPRPMPVEYSGLVGVDKVSQSLEGKILTISFDYQKDSIEKVSYNIENHKFNLIIQSKEGVMPPSTESVEYHYSGGKAEAIMTVGARMFSDLGNLWLKDKDFFEKGKVLNLDVSARNQLFAKINLVDTEAGSISGLITLLLARFKLPLDNDIAGNLLAGLEEATNGYSLARAGAATFEAAAICLKAGGQRPVAKKAVVSPSPDWLEPKIYKGSTLT